MFKLGKVLIRSNFISLKKINPIKAIAVTQKRFYSEHEETDAEFDHRMLEFFKRTDLDAWWVRQGLQELHGADIVPEPEIIIEALRAIRRINDFALAVRFLEAIKFKCGNHEKVIWPYLLGEIQPTLKTLGIPTPEEMGYNKPELALKDPYLE